MAPKKLTEADKVAILGLYRQPEETTSTLAERYGVSNSTISRLLKASLPEAEYKILIQQKRGSGDRDGATGSVVAPAPAPEHGTDPAEVESGSEAVTPSPPEATKAPPILKKRTPTTPETDQETAPEVPRAQTTPQATPAEAPASTPSQTPTRRRRSRSRSDDNHNEEATQLALSTEDALEEVPEEAPEKAPEEALESSRSAPPGPIKKAAPVLAKAAAAEADEEEDWAAAASTTLDDDYGEEEDDDDEDDAWDGDPSDLAPHLDTVEITPLTPNDLPPQCYLVVERVSSELVVLPLKTFASLGQIPEEEGDHRTLPVFDNQRVARRFSRRNQRVIKVPDGNLLQTTRPYLQAKGITRLLIDGHVFALEDKGIEAPV